MYLVLFFSSWQEEEAGHHHPSPKSFGDDQDQDAADPNSPLCFTDQEVASHRCAVAAKCAEHAEGLQGIYIFNDF